VTPEQSAIFHALTPVQQTKAAILAAWATCPDRRWRRWAAAWLDGHDQTSSATLDAETRALWQGDHNASWACNAALHSAGHAFDLHRTVEVTRSAAFQVLSRAEGDGVDLDPILDAVAAGEADRLIPV
jgi:hypothetical protein